MIVPGVGPKDCMMAIVGDVAHEDDVLNNAPYNSSHGNILNGKLHLHRIPRTECYITHTVKMNPYDLWTIKNSKDLSEKFIEKFGEKFKSALDSYKMPKKKNDFDNFYVSKKPSAMLHFWKDILLKELEEINTNVVLAIGAEALWALTGETQIKKWRGSILESTLPSGKKMKVIPTYSVASINKQWNMHPILGFDVKRAKLDSEFPELRRPDRTLKISPTMDEVEQYVLENKDKPEIAFDIETCPTGITCISFATSSKYAISIPTTKTFWGSYDRLRTALGFVADLLYTDSTKIAQNATFDLQYIGRFYGILPKGQIFDTMIAQHSCYSELPKGLDFLASIYTREPYYKDDLKVWFKGASSDDMLWRYNARDSAVTFEIAQVLKNEMEELKVRETYDYMMELLEPLLYMMLKGLHIDRDAINKHKELYEREYDELLKNFNEKFPGVNPHSPQQVAKLVYDTLGMKAGRKGRSTEAKVLEKIASRNDDVLSLLKIRTHKKLVSTYLDVTTDPVDGLLRYSLNSTGTTTGRLSSSSSVFGTGNNLQNWPKKIRDIVVPSKPEYVFTEFDLKGAEAMVVAYLCEDTIMQKLIADGQNIHTYTATEILWPGLTAEDIERDKEECKKLGKMSKYDIAKRVRHGSNYLMTWVTMQDVVKCTPSEAKEYLRRFYQRSPNLVGWHREIETQLLKKPMIETPLGRRRIFFGRTKDIIKDAVAYVPQETVAHVMNIGIIRIYNELCSNADINLICTVHDSGLLEHRPEDAEWIHKKLHELCRVDLRIKGRDFFIPLEISMGKNWGEMKEITSE